jgi:O-antigen/teichoic acid export membrane protein
MATAFAFSALAGLVAAAVLVAVAPLLARALPTFADGRVVVIVALTIPFLLMYVFVHPLLVAVGAFAASAALMVLAYVLLLAALVVTVNILQLGFIGALLAWSIAHAGLVAISLLALARRGRFAAPRLSEFREEMGIGLFTWLVALATLLASRIALLVAGAELEPAAVGRFAVALVLVELLWYAAEAASVGLKPLVARAHLESAEIPTAEVSRTVLELTLIAGAVLFIAAGPVVTVLFGDAYTEAAAAVRWLIPGIVAFSVWRVLMADLVGRGLSRRGLRSALALAAIGTLGAVVLVSPLGITGGAAATTMAYIVATIIVVREYSLVTGVSARELVAPRVADARRLWWRISG